MLVTQFILITVYLISHKQCEMEPHITEGILSKEGQFPYSAYLSIQCVEPDMRKHYFMCGSSILNQYLTLTAAHCTHACTQESQITVSVGFKMSDESAVSTVFGFYNHFDFDPRTLSYDIGIVRLNTPFKFNWKVSRVALMDNPPYFEMAMVVGWGVYDEKKKKYPDVLQYTKQYVKSKDECHFILKEKKQGVFCASSKDGYAGRGDSGSGLVVRDYIQIGIVSYKMKNLQDKNKNVVIYTDTGYFFKWIEEASEVLACIEY